MYTSLNTHKICDQDSVPGVIHDIPYGTGIGRTDQNTDKMLNSDMKMVPLFSTKNFITSVSNYCTQQDSNNLLSVLILTDVLND